MTDIPLKEFSENLIKDLDRRVDMRFVALDKALHLQALEYQRRLDALNHEQARLADDRNRFLARDLFEEYRREISKWQETVNTFRDTSRGKGNGISLLWAVLMGVFGVVMTLAVYLKN